MEDSAEYIDIMKDLLFCKRFIERTEIYRKLRLVLQDDRLLGKKIRKIMASDQSKMKMVIYNIGSIQFTWPSKFRLALCLRIKETMASIFDDIDILDPTLNLYEMLVVTNLNCHVFSNNEPCRKVQRPTMIFLPYTDPILFEKLLEVNWSSSSLNKIALLGPSFQPMMRQLELLISKQRIRRLIAIKEKVMQFNLCKELRGVFEDQEIWQRLKRKEECDGYSPDRESDSTARTRFEESINVHCPVLALHFFNLSEDFDLESLVQSDSSVKEVRSGGRDFDAGRPAHWYIDPNTLVLEKIDEEEAPRVKEELVITMEEIRESESYKRFYFKMLNDPEINANVSRILSSSEKLLNLLIYGPSSLEVTYTFQYHLAFALLLKKDSVFPIAEIEMFYPFITPVDIKVCSDFNIRILSVDERCRRKIERPTILFTPQQSESLVSNMFESNFSEYHLNQMIFVGSIGSDRNYPVNHIFHERARHSWTAERYRIKQVDIIFSELKMNFYRVKDNLLRSFLPYFNPLQSFYCDYNCDANHQEQLMIIDNVRIYQTKHYDPSTEQKDMRFRRPVSYLRRWRLPEEGCVKLNFHGYVDERKGMVGYGGIFHDEVGRLLLSYAAPLKLDADFNTASLESLKVGLKLLYTFSILQSRRLVVEGDALSALRWANNVFPPPERASEVVGEIRDIVETIETIAFCTFLHLYREGNIMAMELARRGAELKGLFIWI